MKIQVIACAFLWTTACAPPPPGAAPDPVGQSGSSTPRAPEASLPGAASPTHRSNLFAGPDWPAASGDRDYCSSGGEATCEGRARFYNETPSRVCFVAVTAELARLDGFCLPAGAERSIDRVPYKTEYCAIMGNAEPGAQSCRGKGHWVLVRQN